LAADGHGKADYCEKTNHEFRILKFPGIRIQFTINSKQIHEFRILEFTGIRIHPIISKKNHEYKNSEFSNSLELECTREF
jgi:hypothetical protein